MINSTLTINELSQFSANNVLGYYKGVTGIVVAGSTTNLDYLVNDDCFITGGIFLCEGHIFGDNVTLQVVDIDNIMGFGAGTVLGEYIKNWYLQSDVQLQFSENIHYPAKIKAGLYLRVIYASTGSNQIKASINYRLHKARY